ncbi:MAG: hypothetical protein F4Y55_14065 [Gammaproteobacteria bacterium]|nr:hypothetical protein [Gammaproteobacteria bacterium]
MAPLVPATADLSGQGFLRVINHSPKSGQVQVVPIDDAGQRYPAVSLRLDSGEAAHFNSDDLERGNTSKGISGGSGSGQGDWRLELLTELDIEVLSYVRGNDGFLTAMHDVVPGTATSHWLPFFNPASNYNQRSLLRLINAGTEPVDVTITGVDDHGNSPGGPVRIVVAPDAAVTLSASDLEDGVGVTGALGDGQGKWRLTVDSSQPIGVMNLLSNPTGHLTNLSSFPVNERQGTFGVPLFPSAGDAEGREGVLRIINRTAQAGEVRIAALDESNWSYDPLRLALPANQAVHLNSHDLEMGNASKGLSGRTGAGKGDWFLELTSDLDIEVLSYVRHWDGFLTSMHDQAPKSGHRAQVAFFNPASNFNQLSQLRLVNPGAEAAEVTISGVDDKGVAAESDVRATVGARNVLTLTAEQLENGIGVQGALGDRSGKWRLTVESNSRIQVMSLMESPTKHLTNLSTSRGAGGADLE